MLDRFGRQLTALCSDHSARGKWVFVPSHAVGHTLGERLTLAGTNWANLRFVTPLDIALRIGAPFLVERGIDPSEDGLGPALIMRLLLDLPEKDGYFRPLGDQPTLAQALWSTLRELRLAGLRAGDLKDEAFRSPAKAGELRALLHAYEQFLAANKRGDMATVYEEALRHPDWCPIAGEDCWTTLPETIWTPLQQRLLDALPGERLVPQALALPGAQRPRRLVSAPVERAAPDPATQPLAFLMSPASASRTKQATIDLFHAGGRDAEIEEVFRHILQSGVTLDEVEIACPSGEYAWLVWERALRNDWPVTIGPGVPATLTRPGRAVLGLCEWIDSDFRASHLRRMLQSGDIRIDADDLTPGQAARLLVKAEAAWGRRTYPLALGRLARRYRAASRNTDLLEEVRAASLDKAARTERVQHWVSERLGAIPQEAGTLVPLQDLVSGVLGFLDDCVSTQSALDAASLGALRAEIEELRALGPFECRLASALRFIRERVDGLTIAGDRARPGHLHVSSLAQAAYTGRRCLFVVGLVEGRVFPSAIEDPILLDDERRRVSAALRLSSDRVEEAVWATLTRLAAHDGAVVLSYSSRDTREYRETYASWLMLQAFRVRERDATKSYTDMRAALGQARSCVPETPDVATTDAGWWLANVKRAGEGARPAVLTHFDGLRRGLAAEAARRSEAFTAYDGFVPAAGKILDPCVIAHGVSATALEDAASCGFRHFLRRGLRLDALGDDERDGDVWLDPLTRGAELHDLYAATLRRCREVKRRADPALDLPWLLETAQARLATLRDEMPPASEEVFERESRDFLADLELFLEEEAATPAGRTPVGFEVGFGRSYGDDDSYREPLASTEPIAIDLGGGLTIRVAGRIDRIDQVGPATFEVIDYKTGGYWSEMWSTGVFRRGTRLQHALYGLVALELLKRTHKKATVAAGVYYFSSAKGGKERRTIATPSRAAILAVLSDLRAMIAAGAFIHTGTHDDCRFCDYHRACGAPGAVDLVEGKRQDPTLAVRLRLERHE